MLAAPSNEYLLPRDASESLRLNSQHRLLTEACKGELLHPAVKLPGGFSMLDCGTGTTVFLQAIAETDSIPFPSSLVGCDFSVAQFPSPSDRTLTLRNGTEVALSLFQHDITQRLPQEHVGKYDLVYQRLLLVGVKRAMWPQVITNLCEALKPGGWIQLVELDVALQYNLESPVASVFKRTQDYLDEAVDSLGFNLQIPQENKGMLEANKLENCEVRQSGEEPQDLCPDSAVRNCLKSIAVPFPFGAAAPLHGLSREYGLASALNAREAFTGCILGARTVSGRDFGTDDQLHKWRDEFLEACQTEGCQAGIGITIGRKPLV